MSEIDIKSTFTEEERRRLERIEKLDSNKKRKKLIIAVVTAVLIMFFVVGTVFGGMYILQFEGTGTLPEEETVYPPLPETEDEILSLMSALIEDTKKYDSIKLDVSFGAGIDGDSITVTGDNADSVKVLLDHVKDSAVKIISDCYSDEHYEGKYNNDFSSVLFPLTFSADDAEITAFTEEENENALKYSVDFGGFSSDELKNKVVYDVFGMESAEKCIDALSERFADMVEVGDADITYESFVITASIDRLKNQLGSINQKRVCLVTLPVTFIGEWEEFGEVTLSFTIEFNKNYNFTRVEFFFTQDVFYIEKGSTDEVKTKVNGVETMADVVISFVSSDESVLYIDKDNFYKGKAVSSEPVTVKGICEYNGVTYEDTCIFYVRVPVEGVKVTEKEVSITKGESREISAAVSPEDATLTGLYWFTTDESIVTVDNESGVITGVKEGTASVYCITLDGNFKSSCIVEVSEKGGND